MQHDYTKLAQLGGGPQATGLGKDTDCLCDVEDNDTDQPGKAYKSVQGKGTQTGVLIASLSYPSADNMASGCQHSVSIMCPVLRIQAAAPSQCPLHNCVHGSMS